jgi:hypothetical protein
MADGGGHRHLRHDCRAAATDQALVGENDVGAFARRRNRCIHPRPTGADDKHVGLYAHGHKSKSPVAR